MKEEKETRIFNWTNGINDEELQEVKKVIENDGVIIFPTDTVYGIGCNCLSEIAIEKIYNLKNRPENKPINVLTDSIEKISTIAKSLNEKEKECAKRLLFYVVQTQKRVLVHLQPFTKYQTKDYLLVPDYNNDYQFSKINLIAFKNAKVSEIKLRYDLYFDSYFLGDYKNKVYLYDNKNELEYYIDLKKKDIYKTDYKINNDGKWESVTNQKLKNNKLSFTNTKYYNYTLKDNKLYGTFKKDYLVTNKDVSKIVKVDNLDIYYISKDTLYYFNPLYGEKPLLKYSEWEFNNTNMIFIY